METPRPLQPVGSVVCVNPRMEWRSPVLQMDWAHILLMTRHSVSLSNLKVSLERRNLSDRGAAVGSYSMFCFPPFSSNILFPYVQRLRANSYRIIQVSCEWWSCDIRRLTYPVRWLWSSKVCCFHGIWHGRLWHGKLSILVFLSHKYMLDILHWPTIHYVPI